MRVTLLFVSAMLAGCASAQEALPVPAGTFWGYTAETRARESTLVVSTDQGNCETARDAHMKLLPGTPTECRSLTLAPGSDYWIVPAVDLPAVRYWGAYNRSRCEAEVERLQSRSAALPTRGCQPVRIDFR